MSGDDVVFVGAAMAPVVAAVTTVSEVLCERPVVVGGLAVLCRLTRAYRATIDLDLVDHPGADRGPAQLEVLRGAPGAETVEPAAVLVATTAGPVKVDVIAVNQAEIDHPSDDVGDRLHATAHAWASDTPTEMSMSVVAAGGALLAAATTLVAEPGPLVAMKLQSVMNRGSDKQGTDLLDIVRLTLDASCGAIATNQIASCPAGMRDDIAQHVRHWLQDKRAWSLGRIRSAGGPDVTEDDIALVAELLLEACASQSGRD